MINEQVSYDQLLHETKKIMLIITESCNLSCSYCYEREKTGNIMSFETACRIIDHEFEDLHLYEKGAIEFFGGEAFLNFELVREVYDYVIEKYDDDRITFYTTTNGTLVHGAIQKWLYDRRERFICSLSLDGTREMHNRNRPFKNSDKGSFDSIDLDFFRNTWPSVAAKMTTSEETLPYLAEGIQYIESLGMDCIATFATGIRWGKPENAGILVDELNKLVDYYCLNPGQKVCKMLDLRLESVFDKVDERFRYCGAGVMMKCYDAKGNWYPCQGFSPISIGDEQARRFLHCDFMDFRLSEDNPCKRCKFLKVCTTCFAANYNTTGNLEKQCHEICLFNRLCVLAGSKIQYSKILKKEEAGELDVNDQIVLKAILEIQEGILDDSFTYL